MPIEAGMPKSGHANRIVRCRNCSSTDIGVIFDLGSMVSCGIFSRPDEPKPAALPLELAQCARCSLVQLGHDFKQDDLFRQAYGYRSGLNEAMISHLAGIVAEIRDRVPLRSGDIVLDIGSNDGTTLGRYDEPGLVRIGIDPTIEVFRQYYQPGIITIADFFTAEKFRSAIPGAKAKVVTSIAMFYDLPDPNAFAGNIVEILAEDGIWVLEQSYLPTMIDRLSFDTICHEHLEYYGLRQIADITKRNGLRIVDAQLNDANGGSFRVTVCRHNAGYVSNTPAIDALLDKELRDGYLGAAPIERLQKGIQEIKAQVISFLVKAKEGGELVHGYGASTKGNTLLQYFGITPDLLPVIAERNPTKFGCLTPGTNIPIISEAESRAQKPDFYFVLPWHFRENFIKREQAFLDQGGGMIFPLPKFEIVRAS